MSSESARAVGNNYGLATALRGEFDGADDRFLRALRTRGNKEQRELSAGRPSSEEAQQCSLVTTKLVEDADVLRRAARRWR